MIFQQPSDDFFASVVLSKLDIKPDAAFIDGMHLIEFILHGFINCEAIMNLRSTIFCMTFVHIIMRKPHVILRK
jgi:hypothetical protein